MIVFGISSILESYQEVIQMSFSFGRGFKRGYCSCLSLFMRSIELFESISSGLLESDMYQYSSFRVLGSRGRKGTR